MEDTAIDVQTLYLVRHGRTLLNAQGRLRGRADPPLDATGSAQAARTAAALRDVGAAAVVSSPLRRAWQTAEAIADAARVSHLVDEGLNDRDYGPQTGRIRSEVAAQWGSLDDAPGVEPADELLRRTEAAVGALCERFAPHPLIVVTHDALIRALLLSLDPGLNPQVETASWQVLRREDRGLVVERLDQSA